MYIFIITGQKTVKCTLLQLFSEQEYRVHYHMHIILEYVLEEPLSQICYVGRSFYFMKFNYEKKSLKPIFHQNMKPRALGTFALELTFDMLQSILGCLVHFSHVGYAHSTQHECGF